MKESTKDKLKVLSIAILLISLLLWGFYIHRDEPHWFDTQYVKIIK